MIPIETIAALLSQVARGEQCFRTVASLSDWRFLVNGYEICIFDDAGECDYVEWAIDPNGKKTTYEEWFIAAQPLWSVQNYNPRDRNDELEGRKLFKAIDPIALLSPADHLALEALMDRELRP